jgi:hypothetical protein
MGMPVATSRHSIFFQAVRTAICGSPITQAYEKSSAMMWQRWRIRLWSALGATAAGYAFSSAIAPTGSSFQLFLFITTSAGLYLVLSGLLSQSGSRK